MVTAIDTNILLDIFTSDPRFMESSKAAFKRCVQEGGVCGCEIVWVETATMFRAKHDFMSAIHSLDLEFSPINAESALVAAELWKKYRQTGGRREKVAPDFLIGAHALTQCDRLLTRDKGFYRHYFADLEIITP
jgi:hypothetical protein